MGISFCSRCLPFVSGRTSHAHLVFVQAEGRHGVQPERGVAGRAPVGGGEKGLRGKGYGDILGLDRRYHMQEICRDLAGRFLAIPGSFKKWLAGFVVCTPPRYPTTAEKSVLILIGCENAPQKHETRRACTPGVANCVIEFTTPTQHRHLYPSSSVKLRAPHVSAGMTLTLTFDLDLDLGL